jgi:hypothetical protein
MSVLQSIAVGGEAAATSVVLLIGLGMVCRSVVTRTEVLEIQFQNAMKTSRLIAGAKARRGISCNALQVNALRVTYPHCPCIPCLGERCQEM